MEVEQRRFNWMLWCQGMKGDKEREWKRKEKMKERKMERWKDWWSNPLEHEQLLDRRLLTQDALLLL